VSGSSVVFPGERAHLLEILDLTALHLDAGKFKTEPCPPQMTFRKLERLTLGSIRLATSRQYVFNPTCMPKLKHLAIWAIDYLESFSAVFPQITTLAIFDLNPTKSGLFLSLSDVLPLLANLQHLSLGNHTSGFPQVFQCFEGSLIESIHLGIHLIRKCPDAAPKLAEMIERQREDGRNRRIVIYGSKTRLYGTSLSESATQPDVLEWREHIQTAPFEYFDGQ